MKDNFKVQVKTISPSNKKTTMLQNLSSFNMERLIILKEKGYRFIANFYKK
jgi:hypothetical protein